MNRATRLQERKLWEFHDQAARELVAANKAQARAYARFEAALDIMTKLVAEGVVRHREDAVSTTACGAPLTRA